MVEKGPPITFIADRPFDHQIDNYEDDDDDDQLLLQEQQQQNCHRHHHRRKDNSNKKKKSKTSSFCHFLLLILMALAFLTVSLYLTRHLILQYLPPAVIRSNFFSQQQSSTFIFILTNSQDNVDDDNDAKPVNLQQQDVDELLKRQSDDEQPTKKYPNKIGRKVDDDESDSPYNKGLHDEHCNAWRSDKINVHIIAHSHDDVGWLKTVDQYYYGDRNDIQNAGVQYIIDGVVRALDKNPDRKYVQVEMAFLARWWHRQNDEMKNTFRRLLRNGQLEIICAGWAMGDEATTDYVGLIDQHSLGFAFINNEIDPDYRPLIAWQVDPFGHSREAASLFAEFGMNGLFFARMDYQDRDHREKTKTTEMLWQLRPSTPDLGLNLFTSGLARSTYCPPGGFDFDVGSNDPPIMDDPRLEGFNADDRAHLFEFLMKAQQLHYPSNQLMVTMGCDFNYASASSWFMNLDALIKAVNNYTDMNAFYSTPSCYTRAVHESVKALTNKTDDFFPYAESPSSFWTGYFTSRVSLKRLVREIVNSYGTVRQLLALKQLPVDSKLQQQLDYMKDTVGIMQHHDAVSGTSKQHVTDDARKRCSNTLDVGNKVMAMAIVDLACSKESKAAACILRVSDVEFCPLLNESYCPFAENRTAFSVVVYNRLAENITAWLRLPLHWSSKTNSLIVTDQAGKSVTVDVFPTLDNDIGSIPTRVNSTANVEAVFQASIPALGSALYFVQLKSMKAAESSDDGGMLLTPNKMQKVGDGTQTFDNGVLRLTLNERGMISSLQNIKDNVNISFHHTLAFYTTTLPPSPTSGAYRFTPDILDLQFFDETEASAIVFPGSQVVEIHRDHSSWAKSIYRLYQGEPYVEVQWIVGPIPVDLDPSSGRKKSSDTPTVGREVVSFFKSSIKNQDLFYTDANGREMLQRKRDFRPTWNFTATQNVSQNYYPIVSRISTKDATAQMTVVTDRAQGASGFRPGSLELMVHRRLTYDDGFGVGEPLMETEDGHGLVASGRMWVTLNSPANAARVYRKVSQRAMFQHSIAFTPVSSAEEWNEANLKVPSSSVVAMPYPIPPNIHMLTLEPNFQGCSLLLRLEHLFEKGEDAVYSMDTQVPLAKFVQSLVGSGVDPNNIYIDELALGANMPIADWVRLKWQTTPVAADVNRRDNGTSSSSSSSSFDQIGLRLLAEQQSLSGGIVGDWDMITMRPMQIRTFCVTVDSIKL